MKKLVSLIMVLALVLGLATAAFAEDAPAAGSSSENPIVSDTIPTEIAIAKPAEGATDPVVVWYEFPAELAGYTIEVTSKLVPALYEVNFMGNASAIWGVEVNANLDEETAEIESYTLTYQLPDLSMGGRPMPGAPTTHVIGFGLDASATQTEAVTLSVKATAPAVGSSFNPAVLELDKDYTVFTMEASYGYEYYLEYTATVGGVLTLDVTNFATSDTYASLFYESDVDNAYLDMAIGEVEIPVSSGASVLIMFSSDPTMSVAFSASFEEAPSGDYLNPVVIEDQDKDYDFTAKGSGVVDENDDTLIYYYKVTDVAGAILTVDSPNAFISIMTSDGNWGDSAESGDDYDEDDDVLTVYVPLNVYGVPVEDVILAVGVMDTNDEFVAGDVIVNVSEPVGFDENAEVLDDISEFTVTVPGFDLENYEILSDSYYVQWTVDAAGKYSFVIDDAQWNAELWGGEENLPVDDEDEPILPNAVLSVFVNGVGVEPTAANASVGDVITICVKENEWDDGTGYMMPAYPADVTVSSTFDALGSATNPIEIIDPADLGGIDVPAKGSVNYAINGKLNGQILTIKVDENATVTLNGEEVKAENGVVTAVLDKTPVNTLTVANKGDKAASYVAAINWPVGSESNPIVIESASDLTGIDVAAGESVYYAINSQLNGQILTINVDDKTVVTLNGKEVEAEDGVVTATLEGTPVNALVVTNKGEKDASYTASIAYELGTEGNPIAVTTEKELNGTEIAAGEEVHYLLNSKMAGAVLSVKGDKAYVIVNGEKTEAKDGFIKLTLEAKGATISLVIGNAGEKAATVTLGYSDNPNTGDAGIMAPIAMALVSAMSTVALVIKKKEF